MSGASSTVREGPIKRLTRSALRGICRRLDGMPFRLTYWDGVSETFGEGRPRFGLTVKNPKTAWKILLAPDPALGDAYMEGDVDIENLDAMLEAYHESLKRGRFSPAFRGLRAFRERSSAPRAQRRQVQFHYDRGNDFFSLWLDASKTYSCAYFRRLDCSLEEAQQAKIDLVLRKAQLTPGQTLLDIGSGWGALVIRAATVYGARARGITLSRLQFDHSVEAIRKEGPGVQANIELADYRDLAGRGERFDRVVSVGMLEHVGRKNLGIFLATVKKLLKPGGVCVLHAIMRSQETPVSSWMDKHIFPGGYIPSWREVIALLPEFDLHLIDDESLRRHYALTLERWRNRFEVKLDNVRELGYDERFIRMWRLYLQGAAAAFKTGEVDLHQLVFTSGVNNQLAWTREALYKSSAV